MVRSVRSRRLRPFAPPQPSYAPIATINTTPLIDMMLVILIMVIVAIPVANHKVPLDLPPPRPVDGTPPPTHVLSIDPGGALAWDGRPLDAAALAPRLTTLREDPAQPVLHLEAAGEARYERVDEVLGEIARARVTRLGFVGNQRFAEALDR
jgi:biopolymer transport protein ExbD